MQVGDIVTFRTGSNLYKVIKVDSKYADIQQIDGTNKGFVRSNVLLLDLRRYRMKSDLPKTREELELEIRNMATRLDVLQEHARTMDDVQEFVPGVIQQSHYKLDAAAYWLRHPSRYLQR